MAYSDCRTLHARMGFSMTHDDFENIVGDMFPAGKKPPVIFKSECRPYEVRTGSFIINGREGRYIYERGDNIIISSVGEGKRDVIFCLR